MVWLLSTLLLLSPPADTLPSRDISAPLFVLIGAEPGNFDLLDLRNEAYEERANTKVEDPHTHFVIKHHVGASIGYDNSIVHGGVGLYMTIAEWGRWNFGVPSVAFGLGRYPTLNRNERSVSMEAQPTVFVSIASVHYRLGFVRAIGYNAYFSLEQVYDLRHNMTGSQFGFSFSSK